MKRGVRNCKKPHAPHKTGQSTKILTQFDLATSIALRIELFDESWLEKSTETHPSSPFIFKLMCSRIASTMMASQLDAVPTTTSRAGRAKVSVMVAKILNKIARRIGSTHAIVHNSKDAPAWGKYIDTRGSGLLLTPAGLYALFAAAGEVFDECRGNAAIY